MREPTHNDDYEEVDGFYIYLITISAAVVLSLVLGQLAANFAVKKIKSIVAEQIEIHEQRSHTD